MLAAYSGLGVTYLGSDVPARDIVQSVTFADAQVAVLGMTSAPRERGIERNLRTVVRQLAPNVELWAGGRDAERYESIITPRGMVFHDYAAYQQELARIGGRVA
jgi:hypothetical protein